MSASRWTIEWKWTYPVNCLCTTTGTRWKLNFGLIQTTCLGCIILCKERITVIIDRTFCVAKGDGGRYMRDGKVHETICWCEPASENCSCYFWKLVPWYTVGLIMDIQGPRLRFAFPPLISLARLFKLDVLAISFPKVEPVAPSWVRAMYYMKLILVAKYEMRVTLVVKTNPV